MSGSYEAAGTVRFGSFELDADAGELRRDGNKVRLQEQPFHILRMLLQNPGKVVSREDLRRKVWPCDTFVDFDHGINNAIKRLREALGDTAETPHFIETLPRRGYRFLAPIDIKEVQPKAIDPINSIAVLPLFSTDSDADSEYLAVGIPASVIQSLSRIPGLRVIAWSMLASVKERDVDPVAIGRKLQVKAVLIGRLCVRGAAAFTNGPSAYKYRSGVVGRSI